MKNRLILLPLLLIVLFSCKKEEKNLTTDELKSDVLQIQLPATQECYEYIQGKDTIQARLLIQVNNVSGDLYYKLFEKDKNSRKNCRNY